MEAKDEIKVYKQKLETYNEKEEEDQIEKNNFFDVVNDNDEIFKVYPLIYCKISIMNDLFVSFL